MAGAALLALGATACGGGEQEQAGDDIPVLAPGAPGESASPATDEQLAAVEESLTHNEADFEYVSRMVAHHEQALEMTDLVPDRAEREEIGKIADRIAAAQDPEIEVMEEWLEANVYGPARENSAHRNYCGLDGGEGHDHGGDCVEVDHSDMPGMASDAQMADLEAAEGEEFDELFVELMVTHHQGAVTMAEEELLDGRHQVVLEMANDVIAEQSVEIGRMREVLGED
ncbi:uncharacterized protein (DUF305 family) [Spinactinospora alkalitolerans]|uniref:Uncharacterized protein (DUF305 family) n=1 Tax=Spinactinospora alkalitolerans TaxID=687207 RepID=A0A852TUA7_9ACTN|nr:DUF305 domain-containing protein [Spinactinospora alkalitolerans]NYE46353.1 uncharacterized protein (DUF305 family) [Spinactinospora alkalitolerans]